MGKKGGPKNKGRLGPQTVAKIEAREALRQLIEADMIELHAAWKDSALGHYVQVKTPSGMMKVYKESPNAIAIRDMFERAFGKPDQKIEGKLILESQNKERMKKRAGEIKCKINVDHPTTILDLDGGNPEGTG